MEVVEFRFNSLSAPRLTRVTANEAASVTVTYSSRNEAYNYAISSIKLHQSHPSKWQVDVIHNPGLWMLLGVIGRN